MKRRDFIKGLAGVSGAAAAGVTVKMLPPMEQDVGVSNIVNSINGNTMTSASITTLLQDGLKKTFSEEYDQYTPEWEKAFKL